MAEHRPRPAELPWSWGQMCALAEALGLRPEDPAPTAAMILQMLEVRVIVDEEADRIALGLDDDGNG